MDGTDRVSELEAEVAHLKVELARVAASQETAAAHSDDGGRSSRRTMLKLAGAAAAGAVVAVGSGSTPVAADDPNDITLGQTKATVAGPTRADYLVNADATNNPYTAFFFQTGTATVNNVALPFGAALTGRTSTANAANGVQGVSTVSAGAGVIGVNIVGGGTGVRGRGDAIGVAGDAVGVLGAGVIGSGLTGVRGNGTAIGVEGIAPVSPGGFGVRGAGETGVLAVGGAVGVNGTVTTAGGVGVNGSGGDDGTGVRGVGGFYALAASKSAKANLYLQPNNDVIPLTGPIPAPVPAGVKTTPTARTDAHLAGELDNVGGDLWFCVVSGTPGTWRKLTGPAGAGSFHALPPGRVYDSRAAAPAPGRLTFPGTRLLNVSARRDITTGAVTQADFVPAGATSISCNVTVVDTVQSGFLAINPGGNLVVNAATVNWSENDQILNNGTMLTLNAAREISVIIGGVAGASTHFVIDVNGYFL